MKKSISVLMTILFLIAGNVDLFAQQGWVFTGLYGGDVETILIDKQTPDIVHGLTGASGLYKTSDEGDYWARVANGLPAKGIGSQYLKMDPRHSSILYINTSTVGGFYKSLDSGVNWVLANNGIEEVYITAIAVSYQDSTLLYAGTMADGFFKSEDAGETWTNIETNNLPEEKIYHIAIHPANDQVLYASMFRDGLYKSTDGGVNWSLINENYAYSVAVYEATPDTILFASNEGILKSTNGGTDWTATNPTDAGVSSIEIADSEPNVVYAFYGGYGIYKSTDYAETWILISDSLPTKAINSIAVHPVNSNIIYAGMTGYGVARKNENDVWEIRNNGIAAINADIALNLQDSTSIYAYTWSAGVYKRNPGSHNWSAYHDSLNSYGHRVWFVGSTADGAIFMIREDDVDTYLLKKGPESEVWSLLDPSLSNQRFLEVSPIDNQRIHLVGESRLKKTTDLGETWNNAFVNLPGFPEAAYTVIAEDPTNDQTLFVGSREHGLFRTRNRGSSFSTVNNGLNSAVIGSDGHIEWIKFHPLYPEIMYCGLLNGGTYKSTNRGDSWTKIAPSRSVTFSRNGKTMYSAQTGGGIYESDNQGDTWYEITDNFPDVLGIQSLLLSREDLFVAASSGIYKRSLSELARPQIRSSSSTVFFDDVEKDSASTTEHVVIHNSGSKNLEVTSIEINNIYFHLNHPELPISVAPGDSFTLDVIFQPRVSGSVSSQIIIKSNDIYRPSIVVGVEGTSLANISGLVQAIVRKPTYDYENDLVTFELGIRNLSQVIIYAPIKAVVTGLPGDKSVTIENSQNDSNGYGAMVDYSFLVPSLLAQNRQSDYYVWEMKNNSGNDFGFKIRFLGIPEQPVLNSSFRDFEFETDVATGQVRVVAQPTHVAETTNSEFPETFELMQNFPNPFNPQTRISYQLAEAGFVNLVIYNLTGQEVRRLVSEDKQAGSYFVDWDGRHNSGKLVASGIYLYKLTAAEFVQTRKLVLVR